MKKNNIIAFRLKVIENAEKHGKSEAARIFKLNRKTVANWVARYNQGGISALQNKSRRDMNHPHKMPESVEQDIIRLKADNPDISAKEIKEKLDIPYSLPVILKKLRFAGLMDDFGNKKVKIPKNEKPFKYFVFQIMEKQIGNDLIFLYLLSCQKTQLSWIGFSGEKTEESAMTFLRYFFGNFGLNGSQLSGSIILQPDENIVSSQTALLDFNKTFSCRIVAGKDKPVPISYSKSPYRYFSEWLSRSAFVNAEIIPIMGEICNLEYNYRLIRESNHKIINFPSAVIPAFTASNIWPNQEPAKTAYNIIDYIKKYVSNGEYKRACEYHKILIQYPGYKALTPYDKINLCRIASKIYHKLYDFNNEDLYLRKALRLSKKCSSDEELKTLLLLSKACLTRCEIGYASRHLLKASSLIDKSGNFEEQVWIELLGGFLEFVKGTPANAELSYKKALYLAGKYSLNELKFTATVLIYNLYFDSRSISDCTVWLNKAERQAIELNNVNLKFRFYLDRMHLALIEKDKLNTDKYRNLIIENLDRVTLRGLLNEALIMLEGDYAKLFGYQAGLRYCVKDWLLGEQIDGVDSTFYAKMFLGCRYRALGMVENAIQCFREAYDFADTHNAQLHKAASAYNLGGLYFASDEFDLAFPYAKTAMDITQKYGNKVYAANMMLFYGRVHSAVGHYSTGLSILRKSVRTFKKYGHLLNLLYTYRTIGDVLFLQHKTKGAITNYNFAINIAEEIGFDPMAIKLYERKCAFYMFTGNRRGAQNTITEAEEHMEKIENYSWKPVIMDMRQMLLREAAVATESRSDNIEAKKKVLRFCSSL